MSQHTQCSQPNNLRVAVITPYYRESLEILRHCHESVRAQTYPCTHFLIADGHPRQEIAAWPAQHLILSQCHDDLGNTPRAVGSLSAMNQDYEAIAYLDADNWYYPNHVEAMLNLQRQTGAAVCTASRSLHRLDGSLIAVDRQDNDGKKHVDTSCMFLTRAAYRLLPLWAMMPRQLGLIGDRVIWQAILSRQLPTAHSPQPTVAFRTQYQAHYRLTGEAAPPGAKSNEASTGKAVSWWNSLQEFVRQDWCNYLGGAPSAPARASPLPTEK
jgi:hypothetical protein